MLISLLKLYIYIIPSITRHTQTQITMPFSVTKSSGTLVKPSEKTPDASLELSFMDKIPVLRCYVRTLHVFKHGVGAAGVIRQALSKALVPYYPLAGRLKETSRQGHLQIACSSEGAWFVHATADCTLHAVDYFHETASIPYQKLLLDQPSSASLSLDPLLLMQVTEFECGGFVMGLTFCHAICDGVGAAQFLNAVGEMARGVEKLSVEPVWHRDFLLPFHTSQNNGFVPPPPPPAVPEHRLEQADLDISLDKINEVKRGFEEWSGGQRCSAFEVLAASLWRCRSRAVNYDGSTEVSLVFFANCRQLLNPPPPKGFYGNCFFPMRITASAGSLANTGMLGVVKLIKAGKDKLPSEFMRWSKGEAEIDPFAPPPDPYTTLFVSEWARLGFNEIDYGWGLPSHVVPVQGSPIIPAAIVGYSPTSAQKGFRLMTWCVEEAHLKPFLNAMNTLTHY